jgi:hypothetical protein
MYLSNLIRVRTHTIADTSGISVCFANVADSVLLENAKLALKEMRAKWSEKIEIDTTHFVCTRSPASRWCYSCSECGIPTRLAVGHPRSSTAVDISVSQRKEIRICAFIYSAGPIANPSFVSQNGANIGLLSWCYPSDVIWLLPASSIDVAYFSTQRHVSSSQKLGITSEPTRNTTLYATSTTSKHARSNSWGRGRRGSTTRPDTL